MKTNLFLCLFLFCGIMNAQHLFTIIDNGKIGYINNKGEVILPPVYRSGTNYVNGVAAVRTDGYYGLIDTSGNYILTPEYDFICEPVKNYTAYHKNGATNLVSNKGIIIYTNGVKHVSIEDKTIVIETNSGICGVYNILLSKMVTDTLFTSIDSFKDNVAVAYITGPDKKEQVCVIDNLGNYIVRPGLYKNIDSYSNGIALAELDNGNKGAIDGKGNLLFTRKENADNYISQPFNNGFAVVSFTNTKLKQGKVKKYSNPYYKDYIDTKGNLILKDTIYSKLGNFSCNRAFVTLKDASGKERLIDTHFKFVTNNSFKNVTEQGFTNGYALVEDTTGWGVIDTLGNYVVPPQFYEIDDRAGIVDGYFFYSPDTRNDVKLYGIVSVTKGIIVQPILERYDSNGYTNGLIKVYVNGRLTYIDEEGNIVWQEKKCIAPEGPKPLNIDFMMRGYLHAYDNTTKSSNGWAESRNFPKKITKGKFEKDKLVAFIDVKAPSVFTESCKGVTFYIANTTKDSIHFPAQDSRLTVKLQAQDIDETWKDIEYLPSSWCGNSYHTLILAPGEYWQFTVPDYVGAIKTKIRAEITYGKGKEKQVLYSNQIEASINPAQFFNHVKYTPSGIMDPYND